MKNRDAEEMDSNPMFSRIGRRIILIMVILSGAVTLAMTITQTSSTTTVSSIMSKLGMMKSKPFTPSFSPAHCGIMT